MDDELEDPQEESPEDFLEQLLGGFLGGESAAEAARAMKESGFDLSSMGQFPSPQALSQAMNQFRFLMNSSNEPVNWRVVEDISRQAAYQGGDPRLSASQASQVRQALAVADLWLDPITDFTSRGGEKEAWTRVDWVDQTLPAWKEIFNPIAMNVSRSMTDAMADQMDVAPDLHGPMEALMGQLSQMVPRMAAMSFGAQVGQGMAAMAKESFGTSDSGLPLTESGISALIPTNVAAFAEELSEHYQVVEHFIAVREMAHVRLFASVPWLRHDLLLAIKRYAEEITLDAEAIAGAARSIDPRDPQSLSNAMSGGIFASEPTEAQERAQERLETLLSLIEGWVEVVTADAVAPYLPNAGRLQEMLRRRRVTGSPAEKMLGQAVGLELRPRQARAAAQIFRRLEDEGGSAARDAVWAHPDHVPTAEHLANPEQFGQPTETDAAMSEFDLEMQQLLEGTLGWDAGVPQDRRTQTPEDPSEPGAEPESSDS